MNTPPNGSAYMLAQDTIARLTKENAALSAQLAAANADPNDIEINTPLSEKVDRYKLVPVAEWEAIKQARADRDVLAAEVRAWRLITTKNGWTGTMPVGMMVATNVSRALNRAKGGGA